MRCYLPASLALLEVLESSGTLSLDDAITSFDETEDAEYSALMTAAAASCELAVELEPGRRRRVVVVVEVASDVGRITLGDVVAVHADELDLPDGYDPYDDLDDSLDEPGWYATQEIPTLLAR